MTLFQGWQIPERIAEISRKAAALSGGWPSSRAYQLTLQLPELAAAATSEQTLKAPDDAPWWWFGNAAAFAGGEAALDSFGRLQLSFGIGETSRQLAFGRQQETAGRPDSGFLPFNNVVGRLTDPFWWDYPVPLELGDVIVVRLVNNAGVTIPSGFLTLFGFQFLYSTPNSPGRGLRGVL